MSRMYPDLAVNGVCHGLPERWEVLEGLPSLATLVVSMTLYFPAAFGSQYARVGVEVDDHASTLSRDFLI